MTPERYERLCELFDQAQARSPGERTALLEEVGRADPALRAELESMLAGLGGLPARTGALLRVEERGIFLAVTSLCAPLAEAT
jgi:hypothetical protein